MNPLTKITLTKITLTKKITGTIQDEDLMNTPGLKSADVDISTKLSVYNSENIKPALNFMKEYRSMDFSRLKMSSIQ